MPLYGCQTPDGYKNTEEAWLSPEATTQRINFASRSPAGFCRSAPQPERMHAVAEPDADQPRPDPVDAARASKIFCATLSRSTRAAVAAAPPALRAALILGSPDFMRR